MRIFLLLLSHLAVLAIGFAAGIFTLPLLTAPAAPALQAVMAAADEAQFTTTFVKDLADSDFLHNGEGEVMIHQDRVSFAGTLTPGPDYRLYFSDTFVETEAEFLRLKSTMRDAGPIRTFNNFIVPLPGDLDPADYRAVIVWCESFDQFITAGQYQ